MPRLSLGARYMILAAALFSGMQVCVKALPRIPAHEIVLFRGLVSVSLCWTLLRARRMSPWGKHKWGLVARGITGSIALLLFFYTIHRIPLATASTIQQLAPIFTLTLAGVFFGEKVKPAQVLWFAVAFGGVAMAQGLDPRVLGDAGIGMLSAFFSGLAYNLVRRLRHTDPVLVVVFYLPLMTVPLAGAVCLALGWVTPRGWEWAWLIAVGVITQLAQMAMTHAYHLEEAGRVSQYSYLAPILSGAWGWFFFSEGLRPGVIAGMGLALFGMWGAASLSRPALRSSPTQ
jgi:drug/metabolite transporter (DMT)-like permease